MPIKLWKTSLGIWEHQTTSRVKMSKCKLEIPGNTSEKGQHQRYNTEPYHQGQNMKSDQFKTLKKGAKTPRGRSGADERS